MYEALPQIALLGPLENSALLRKFKVWTLSNSNLIHQENSPDICTPRMLFNYFLSKTLKKINFASGEYL
jgi:hypothetical protein